MDVISQNFEVMGKFYYTHCLAEHLSQQQKLAQQLYGIFIW